MRWVGWGVAASINSNDYGTQIVENPKYNREYGGKKRRKRKVRRNAYIYTTAEEKKQSRIFATMSLCILRRKKKRMSHWFRAHSEIPFFQKKKKEKYKQIRELP